MPRIPSRQIGQCLRAGAQSLQQTRWPHLRKTTFTSLSMHTLQVRSSFIFCTSCSSAASAQNKTKSILNKKFNQSSAKFDSEMRSRHAPVFVESMMSSSSSFGSLLLFFFRLRRFLFFFLEEAFPLFSASVCFCSAPLSVTTSVSLVVSNKNINITKIKH